jgi:hypothetical protein
MQTDLFLLQGTAKICRPKSPGFLISNGFTVRLNSRRRLTFAKERRQLRGNLLQHDFHSYAKVQDPTGKKGIRGNNRLSSLLREPPSVIISNISAGGALSLFITFEGIEGCGKTIRIGQPPSHFPKTNRPFVVTREPQGLG